VSYLAILRGYADAEHLAVAEAGTIGLPAPRVAAWLTGQSAWRHSQLSPGQAAVLDEIAGLGFVAVRGGFPYNRRALALPYADEPLLPASLRNAAQMAASLASPAFAAEVSRHLQPLLAATTGRLLLLCGSCGLQLFAAALPRLAVPAELRIGLVAVGPVCFTPAAALAAHRQVDLCVVRGTRDWISRFGCRATADLRPPVDHLGYTVHPEGRRALFQAAEALAGA
jgi:hypothetical protein